MYFYLQGDMYGLFIPSSDTESGGYCIGIKKATSNMRQLFKAILFRPVILLQNYASELSSAPESAGISLDSTSATGAGLGSDFFT